MKAKISKLILLIVVVKLFLDVTYKFYTLQEKVISFRLKEVGE